MKRMLCFLLAGAMALGLCCCGPAAPVTAEQPTAAPAGYPAAGYGAPAAAAPAQPAQGNNYGGVFDEDPPF